MWRESTEENADRTSERRMQENDRMENFESKKERSKRKEIDYFNRKRGVPV